MADVTLNFTDTTLTGTLTVVATTDQPTGGDESSAGNGASGFNVRALDGSVDGWLLAFLAGLPALQRRRAYAARHQSLS